MCSLTLFCVLTPYAVHGFFPIAPLSGQSSFMKTSFVFFPSIFWPLVFYYILMGCACFFFVFCLSSLHWLSWRCLKAVWETCSELLISWMVLSAFFFFFSAFREFLFSLEAESMGLPVFFYLLFFQMWLANWLDTIAEQTMHKVKPWQILVQGVHKMIDTAQGHFTGSMIVNWAPSSLYLESSTYFHVIICFRVGFLLLGCSVGVHVIFLSFLRGCDPEDLLPC